MDSDKVLVMSSGKMVEFDHPYTLLNIPNGHFARMVAETGPSMSQQLRDVALASFKRNNADKMEM